MSEPIRYAAVFTHRGGKDEFVVFNGDLLGTDELEVRKAATMFGIVEGVMLGLRFTGEVLDLETDDQPFYEGRADRYPASLYSLGFIRGPQFEAMEAKARGEVSS